MNNWQSQGTGGQWGPWGDSVRSLPAAPVGRGDGSSGHYPMVAASSGHNLRGLKQHTFTHLWGRRCDTGRAHRAQVVSREHPSQVPGRMRSFAFSPAVRGGGRWPHITPNSASRVTSL